VAFLVMGVDPGTYATGYGLIRMRAREGEVVDFGVIQIARDLAFPERLKRIHHSLLEILDRYKPDAMAVEEVFVSQNAKTTLRLGHTRGVILLAGSERDVPIAEYAPREIKQAVYGKGNASKEQVQWMLIQTFRLPKEIDPDAADGLATAWCHGLRATVQQSYRG
jgi:crossover junction endodeoxyribonuclease RuvC